MEPLSENNNIQSEIEQTPLVNSDGALIDSSNQAAAPDSQTLAPSPAAAGEAPIASGENTPQAPSLFVGNLPLDLKEDDLEKHFSQGGTFRVNNVKIIRDNGTRRSTGIGFVNFFNMADAEEALKSLYYMSIREGDPPYDLQWLQHDKKKRISSEGNIYIRNLNKSVTRKHLRDTFSFFGPILSVRVPTNDAGEPLGYGMVHFVDKKDAEEAIRKVDGLEIMGEKISVTNYVPRCLRKSKDEFTNLYVKNLPKHWPEERLFSLFEPCGKILKHKLFVDESGQSKGFGFVNFESHESAQKAIEKLNENEVPIDEQSEALLKKKESEPEKASKETTEESEEAPEVEPTTLKLYVGRAKTKKERSEEWAEKHDQIRQASYNKGVNLFVRNLHEDVTEDMLYEEFSKFGSITSLRIMYENLEVQRKDVSAADVSQEGDAKKADSEKPKKKVQLSKGFGFVCFSTAEEANSALMEMNGFILKGKPLTVALAQEKQARLAQMRQEKQEMAARARFSPGMFAPGVYPVPAVPGMIPSAGIVGPQPGMNPRAIRSFVPPMGQMAASQGMPHRGGFSAPMPQMVGQYGAVAHIIGQPGMPMDGHRPKQANKARAGVKPNKAGHQAQGQYVVYNNKVRNQPEMHPMMQQNEMNPIVMMPGLPHRNLMAPEQPRLDASSMVNLTHDEKAKFFGDSLYRKVQDIEPEKAGKITGMLLDMDTASLSNCDLNADYLKSKVEEALAVLNRDKGESERK